MEQLSFFQLPTWSVSDLTRYLRSVLESDERLQELWVQGEVSNVSRPSSGHLYFTLKDQGASIKCVMWKNAVLRQRFLPREGEAVEAHGAINVYEAGGVYQLYADLLRPAGEGALYREFLRLKAALEQEGLFDAARKRPLPAWPERIGVVTSKSGAALRDILNTLRRRYPLSQVVLAACAVQGNEAPAAIVCAIEDLNTYVQPDVIIVARGGGSIEDLWAFNDERVARAIVNSAAPVITGVGHETDYTIADFVSDLRAPTPTAAAELATPDREELGSQMRELASRASRSMIYYTQHKRRALREQEQTLKLYSPLARIRSGRQQIDELERRAQRALGYVLRLKRTESLGLEQRLNALSPLAILKRGYALVNRANGELVRQPEQVQGGETLDVRVVGGSFRVKVQEGEEKL